MSGKIQIFENRKTINLMKLIDWNFSNEISNKKKSKYKLLQGKIKIFIAIN